MYLQLTSANEYATHSERTDIPSHDQTMTAGPPATIPTISVPPNAVQLVTIEKLKPTMPIKLKERLSSIIWSENDQYAIQRPIVAELPFQSIPCS